MDRGIREPVGRWRASIALAAPAVVRTLSIARLLEAVSSGSSPCRGQSTGSRPSADWPWGDRPVLPQAFRRESVVRAVVMPSNSASMRSALILTPLFRPVIQL